MPAPQCGKVIPHWGAGTFFIFITGCSSNAEVERTLLEREPLKLSFDRFDIDMEMKEIMVEFSTNLPEGFLFKRMTIQKLEGPLTLDVSKSGEILEGQPVEFNIKNHEENILVSGE